MNIKGVPESVRNQASDFLIETIGYLRDGGSFDFVAEVIDGLDYTKTENSKFLDYLCFDILLTARDRLRWCFPDGVDAARLNRFVSVTGQEVWEMCGVGPEDMYSIAAGLVDPERSHHGGEQYLIPGALALVAVLSPVDDEGLREDRDSVKERYVTDDRNGAWDDDDH
ncbi:hypothetical protein [Gordonia sp. (in: high G+C Gram-positive bacteria)]|uniref:hypothetical protein n=1 Tax=Gordonia sp. (in: high G+C Gram-positive bacteria) TaxID=84139 RepID=UPI002619CA30|nr:hypothetical protein [Gordonia sp. (in: high G+C Gram-positive bacteria)]